MEAVTVLQNGKLLKYQTIDGGNVEEYSKIKNTAEFGVLQSTAGEPTEEDWADLATMQGLTKEEYKNLLKKSQDR